MCDFEQALKEFNASLYEYKPLALKMTLLKQRIERAIYFLPFYYEKNENTLDKIERFTDELNIIFECFIIFDDFSNVTRYTYQPVKELMEKCIKLEEDVSDEIKSIIKLAEQVKAKLDAFVKLIKGEQNTMYARIGIEFFIEQALSLSPESFKLQDRLFELKADMETIMVFYYYYDIKKYIYILERAGEIIILEGCQMERNYWHKELNYH